MTSPNSQAGVTDLSYTGQRDLGMGLMDYKARFYSPVLGRFTQPDTLIPGADNPQAWNRFSYVMNSPILYNDPSGHMRTNENGSDGTKGCKKKSYCEYAQEKSDAEIEARKAAKEAAKAAKEAAKNGSSTETPTVTGTPTATSTSTIIPTPT